VAAVEDQEEADHRIDEVTQLGRRLRTLIDTYQDNVTAEARVTVVEDDLVRDGSGIPPRTAKVIG
jgi:hypothetical protein